MQTHYAQITGVTKMRSKPKKARTLCGVSALIDEIVVDQKPTCPDCIHLKHEQGGPDTLARELDELMPKLNL